MVATTLSILGSSSVVASLKIEQRLSSVKDDLSLFLFVFMTENVCSHTYVLPNSDKIRQAKSLTAPYLTELRLP